MSRGKRVFQNVLGDWPEVYQTGPGKFEIVARHETPQAINILLQICLIAPITLPFVLIPLADKYNWVYVAVATVLGCSIVYAVVWRIMTGIKVFTTRTTRISLDGGAIKWRKNVVTRDMERVFRASRHRLRISQVSDERGSKKASATFNGSSEVFIDTGPGQMHPRLVAEIADDEFLERGHALAATIRHIDEKAKNEVDREEIRKRRQVRF
jgi:hypothetical protein